MSLVQNHGHKRPTIYQIPFMEPICEYMWPIDPIHFSIIKIIFIFFCSLDKITAATTAHIQWHGHGGRAARDRRLSKGKGNSSFFLSPSFALCHPLMVFRWNPFHFFFLCLACKLYSCWFFSMDLYPSGAWTLSTLLSFSHYLCMQWDAPILSISSLLAYDYIRG